MQNTVNPILTRSNVRVSGRGAQAIVLLHGLGCNQTLWQALLPAFEARYRVVLLDLIGCGESEVAAYDRERHDTLAGHATDLLAVLAALELTNVVFVGHSVVAMIGVIAAVREPARFARLVLLSPSPRFLNGRDYVGGYERADLEELLGFLQVDQPGWSAAVAGLVVGDNDQPELMMAFSNSFANTNPEVMRHFARVAFMCDCRDQLPLVSTPTLIVQAARDAMAPLGVGHYIYEQLPDSQLAIIDTSGHCPHLTAPQQTLAAIGRFLGRDLVLPGPAAGPTVALAHTGAAWPAGVGGPAVATAFIPPVVPVPPARLTAVG